MVWEFFEPKGRYTTLKNPIGNIAYEHSSNQNVETPWNLVYFLGISGVHKAREKHEFKKGNIYIKNNHAKLKQN